MRQVMKAKIYYTVK